MLRDGPPDHSANIGSRGFEGFRSAVVTIAVSELLHCIRKGQFRLALLEWGHMT